VRFPFTIDGRDMAVRFADGEVTVGEVVHAASAGAAFHQGTATVGGRRVALDVPFFDAALRPGDELRSSGEVDHDVEPGRWAIHVIAGIDAGRMIPIPASGEHDAVDVTIGRSASMAARLHSDAVSKHHCTITVDRGALTIVDAGSRNGTVVRGERIGREPVAIDVGESIRCGPAVIVVRAVPVAETPRSVAASLASAPSGPVPFYRSPIDLAPGPPQTVEAPAGPRRPRTGRPGLIGLLLPIALAGALVWFTKQWFYALFALMGPMMLLVTSADRAGRNRRIRKRSRRRYQGELVEFGDELADAVEYEQRRRRTTHPDPATLVRQATHASAALWNRRPGHPQFLELSLGLGDIPWDPPVTDLPDGAPDLEAMVDRARVLHLSPLSIAAAAGTVIGLAGDRASALSTGRGLLLQATAQHGPAEVRIVLVASRQDADDWDWAKWLPHLRPTFAEGRLLAVVADDHGFVDGAAIDEVLADAESGASLVAVIDTAGLADTGDLAIRRLLRRPGAAVAGIVVAATVDGLPDQCDVVVEHHESAGEATCRWPREGGRSQEIVVAGVSIATASAAARGLARLSDPDAGGGSASLPARVGHAEVVGLDAAGPADVTDRWESAGPLTAVLGLGEHGPVTVDLDADGPHLVVVGGRGAGKTEHLAGIVFSLAAGQPPQRMHLVLWGESFGHLHRLPHVASSVNRIDEGTVNTVVEGIDRELTRRERLRTTGGHAGPPASEPRLVIVVDDVDTIVRLVPRAADELVRLWRRARGLGVHLVWSTGRAGGGVMSDLVDLSQVRVGLRVANTADSNDLLGTDAAARLERSLPGRGYVAAGRADPREVQGGVVSIGAPRPSARLEVAPFALATGRSAASPVRLGPPDERALVGLMTAAGATAPRPADLLSPSAAVVSALESPGLLELLGINGSGGLATVTETWQTIDSEQFLRAPIGVDPELRPVPLDIKESALAGMGPHGLLVGATGSGKSELLRTLVCGLALTHSPEALAFVLVDFKGGASFASLGRLPHVAGLVTNLADDLALVDRILAALGGEQRRRQELLAAAGNLANAREYRAAYRAGTLPPALADEPLPELLIIVDEFAELLDQEPAFIDFFLTIGRVGRSLGIHLLLASQRLEEGKLRGLDTYLSYRLGLRTFSAAESRIVLGVPDAYSLPPAPGGGYLKVGTTAFERFQASYVSGPVADVEGDEVVDAPDAVGDDGPARASHAGDEAEDRSTAGPTVLDAVVARLADAAPAVHQIWLPPLTASIPLDRLFGDAGFVHDANRGFAAAGWPHTGRLAVPVGVVDEPELQRQVPLVLDVAGAHGNMAVAGAPQTGKSVLLRTMILSLAVTHTPAEVQIYAVDFGGGTLEALAGLPHVGAVASRLEPERVRRLIGHVEEVLAEREALFRERGVDSVATFRAIKRDGDLAGANGADIVLVIDGWAAFRERFEALEPTIADLAARGLGYGIHVVITANRWMEVRPAVLDAIGGRLELRLNSPVDSLVDRRRAAVIRPDQPGRGLHPSNHLFQIALPRLDASSTVDNLQAATKVAVEHIASRWDGAAAPAVRLLPTHVSVDELDVATDGHPTGVPVGLVEDGMRPWWFDLDGSDPHFLVFGDGESGKTTFLHTWLNGLSSRVPPDAAQVVLVDYRRTLLEAVPEQYLQGYAASEPAARELIEAVAEMAVSRLPGADVTATQLRQRSWWSGPDLFVVVDDYDLVVTPSGNPLQPLLTLLAQGRDVGLHLVLARRVAGAAKAMYEPITARLREVSPAGLILSGDRDEGPLLGAVRASEQPPGRGVLVARRRLPVLVQVASAAASSDAH
jgi:S-DNA-T family DNA segregation ATPase FtsK/SpoIIIE